MMSLGVCGPLRQSALESCDEQVLSPSSVPSPGRGARDAAGKSVEILTSEVPASLVSRLLMIISPCRNTRTLTCAPTVSL